MTSGIRAGDGVGIVALGLTCFANLNTFEIYGNINGRTRWPLGDIGDAQRVYVCCGGLGHVSWAKEHLSGGLQEILANAISQCGRGAVQHAVHD